MFDPSRTGRLRRQPEQPEQPVVSPSQNTTIPLMKRRAPPLLDIAVMGSNDARSPISFSAALCSCATNHCHQ